MGRTPIMTMRGSACFEYRVVQVSRSAFDVAEPAIADFVSRRSVLVVVDSRVDAFYGASIRRYLNARDIRVLSYVKIKANEAHKDWNSVLALSREAIRCDLPRDGVVIGVGGGVVMDLAGLVASVYRRGVDYLRVPTTLIGLVDAGVGIKHGVNDSGRKNILGAFCPPIGVVSDMSLLATLDRRSIVSGLAEILKVAVLSDIGLLNVVERYGSALVESRFQRPKATALHVLTRATELHLRELEGNLFEHDVRRRLDFGHSFSPTIETRSLYRVWHGEAVAIDMLLSTAIASGKGRCSSAHLRRLTTIFRKVGLPLYDEGCQARDLFEGLQTVRQNRGGMLNLVLPLEFGRVEFAQYVSQDELASAWEYCRRAHIVEADGMPSTVPCSP
jgi:3-dehydroquinate synthase